jgi:tetratricopeptide (TPR) repeat protein/predicted Ser/Thr protein kinase
MDAPHEADTTLDVNKRAALSESDSSWAATIPSPKRSQAPGSLRSFPVPEWDRYTIVEFLGAGGMGRVFKARDPRLGRFVALKLIRGDDPALVGRFLREAQAQARIEHEHICKVYEVGEVGGHPYIAMQYIPGVSLKEAKDGMTLEQKIDVVRRVATGLHAAHRIGLIHRDIKPANIMLEQGEDGALHPYIMDFGLAREAHAPGQTMTGTIEGTPSYMAPEQARGEVHRLDRRTDVYSLGATLYELLGGKPPFSGGSGLEIMLALVNEEPEPVRKLYSAVPADLETIVMKCLEKEASRRYESARALADDLGRYLEGEPILARPAGLAYRVLLRAKKHKAIVAVSAAALLSVLLLGGAWIRARLSAAEQASLAQQLGQDVKEIETLMRLAYSLPLHDTRREKAIIRERMGVIERRMGEVAALGEGPGHYALGRGHLALHEYEAAVRHLRAAMLAGHTGPDVARAMGQALGELYRDALDKAQRIEDKAAREERIKEAEASYLEPALRHLQESGAARAESQPYIEGLIALYGKQREEALRKAKEAFEQSPWLHEAKKLEGDVHFAEANDARKRGDYEEALRLYEIAAACFRAAADIARSDAGIHNAEAGTWIEVMNAELRLGRSPQASLDQALAAIDRSLSASPEEGEAYRNKAQALFHMMRYRVSRSEDPSALMEKAVEAANEAIRLNPGDALAFNRIAALYITRGQYEFSLRRDPRPWIARAAESNRGALKVNPNFGWAWNDTGVGYAVSAEYELAQGLDPRSSCLQSIDSYKRALAANPRDEEPHANICYVMSMGASYELDHGGDPRPSLQSALAACGEAIKLDPSYHVTHTNSSLCHTIESRYELATGHDPRGSADKAIESAAAAVRLNPMDVEARRSAVAAYHVKALYAMERGDDPAELIRRALALLDESDALVPSEPFAALLRGELALSVAQWTARRFDGEGEPRRKAEAAIDQALKLNPDRADVLELTARLYQMNAERPGRAKRDVDAAVALGLAAAEEALSKSPRMARALATRGALHLAAAHAERRAGEKQEAARRAKASLEEALRENKNLDRALRPLLDETARLSQGAGL